MEMNRSPWHVAATGIPDPGGIAAISRWLSASDTTGTTRRKSGGEPHVVFGTLLSRHFRCGGGPHHPHHGTDLRGPLSGSPFPDFTIGIENKIYHWLANDLEHYAQQLEQISAGKHTQYNIVPGLQAIHGALPGGFRSHTYREFWTHVRQGLDHRIHNPQPKWLTHLSDFMAQTENLTGSTFEIKPTDRFFIEHEALPA